MRPAHEVKAGFGGDSAGGGVACRLVQPTISSVGVTTSFFQKRCREGAPKWWSTVLITAQGRWGKAVHRGHCCRIYVDREANDLGSIAG
jgi:hypothetical protein